MDTQKRQGHRESLAVVYSFPMPPPFLLEQANRVRRESGEVDKGRSKFVWRRWREWEVDRYIDRWRKTVKLVANTALQITTRNRSLPLLLLQLALIPSGLLLLTWTTGVDGDGRRDVFQLFLGGPPRMWGLADWGYRDWPFGLFATLPIGNLAWWPFCFFPELLI